jgi:hypothetical protein
MITRTRIHNIEKKLSGKNVEYSLIAKIQNWIYAEISHNDKKDQVTKQEWEAYKQHCLQYSTNKNKTLKELIEEENTIRSNRGFMEVEIVLDIPAEIKAIIE